MIKYVLLLILSFANVAYAQTDTLTYYMDFDDERCEPEYAYLYRKQWKDGQFWHVKDYYVKERTLNMERTFSDSTLLVKQGIFHFYYPDGQLSAISRFSKNEFEGFHSCYYENGNLKDSARFKSGVIKGKRIFLYENGEIERVCIFDSSGLGKGDVWEYYENGKLSLFEHYDTYETRDSVQQYFHPNGILACEETCNHGVITAARYYDTLGRPVRKPKDSGRIRLRNRKAKNYVFENMIRTNCPSHLEGKKGMLVLEMNIDINGKMTSKILQSVEPCFDNTLKSMIENYYVNSVIYEKNRPISVTTKLMMKYPERTTKIIE